VVSVIVPPAQTAVGVALPLIFGIGVVGVFVTVTEVIPIPLLHPAAVTVTLYVPDMAAVAPAITGF
jgi:hypothetical protein